MIEVVRPIYDRAEQRLDRRCTIGGEKNHLTALLGGAVWPPSVRGEDFATHEDLLANVKDKLKRRIYHGYALIWWSEEFPLLEWLREQVCPVEYRAIIPPGIQLQLPLPD